MKKSILSVFLVIALLNSILALPAFAAGETLTFTTTAASTGVKAGDTFNVSVDSKAISGAYSGDVKIKFDNTVFEVTALTWNTTIPATVHSTVEEANTNGFFSKGYVDNTNFEVLPIPDNTTFVTATFKVREGATSGASAIELVYMFTDEYSRELSGITANTTELSITVLKAPISDVSAIAAKVDDPVKGITLDTSVTLDSAAAYTGTVEWYKGDAVSGSTVTGAAEANTVYTAKITLTANSGESFANSLNGTNTGDGYKIKWLSADKLELTKTFPATADKDPATVGTAPTAKTGLEYAVIEQELVNAGTATNGTMQYKLGSDGTWSGDIPKAADAGEYTVYYKAKGDSSHSDSEVKSVTVTIAPMDIGDSDVEVKPIPAETYDGTEKTPEPVVQNRDDPLTPDTDYTVSYSNNTNAGTATVTIKGKGNYGGQRTENFTINKAAQTITVPTGDQTVSFGNTLDLKTLCSSNAPGATLTFAVKGGSTAPSGTSLTGSTVTAGNTEGTFIVTVNSAAVTNYEAAAEQEFTVKVVNLPAASVTTAPAAKTGLMYNGTEQALITAGVADGGEMQYKLAGGSYGSELPKAENAGTYTVYYKAKGDSAHSDSTEQSFTVTIGKKPATVAPKSFTITKGDAIPVFELTYTGLVSGDALTPSAAPTFTCYESDGTTPVSTSTQAGTYTITWTNESTTTFTGADNYNLTKTTTATLTISNPPSGGGSSGGSSSVTTYAITASAGEGGKISPSGKVSAVRNSNKAFTMTADEGYEIADVVVDGKSVGAVEQYAFEQIRANHTIHVTFAQTIDEGETPLGPHPFTDVPEDSYYEDAVLWAVNKGITSGTSATTFAPDGICTRAQAVTFLWRAAGSPAPETSAMPFADVPAGSWYYDAVLWAVEQGITSGTSATTFAPDLNCSRAQIVTFLWRSAKSPAAGAANPFTDVKADAYYADAVLWAVKEGVTNGSSATTFSPDVDCSRAQIVTFIYRHMTK